MATRFDLGNCNARRHNEDAEPCLRFMRERYGDGVVKELEVMKAGRRKVTDDESREALGRLRALAQSLSWEAIRAGSFQAA